MPFYVEKSDASSENDREDVFSGSDDFLGFYDEYGC
jgi:hypothetical protein